MARVRPRQRRAWILFTLALVLVTCVSNLSARRLTIVVGEKALPAEKYAAQELQKYVQTLYRFTPRIVNDLTADSAGPAVLLGSPASNRRVAEVAGGLKWEAIRNDGFFLKTVKTSPDVLVIGGHEARGTLFGVYELLERWGVRFSLTEDILPPKASALRLSGFDEKCEPAYAIRTMWDLNNIPEGSAPWDVKDFQRFIDQMAKLKYNTYSVVIMESGPWLDYSFRGLRRPAGDIFYGWRYKIDEQFVGKELFPGQKEFYNPVLAPARNDEERKQLGIGLARSVIAHCQQRGLMSKLFFSMLEPPTAFKHKMNDWATLPLPDPKNFPNAHLFETPTEELGTNPKFSAWMNVKDPVVAELTRVRLKALIDTYPGADFYELAVSEHRAGVVDYREIFKELDARYHLTPQFNLDKELANPGTFPYGLTRYQNQFKGDLLFLWLFDRLFSQDHLLDQTVKPNATVSLEGTMPELWPLLAKIMPKGMTFCEFLEYGVHATADRIDDIIPVLKAKLPTTILIGVQDDNTMWFPQVNVESMERIVHTTAPLEMQGYTAAIWQVRQSDINCAFLGRASWQPKVTANEFYQDYLTHFVGPAAAPDFEKAQRLLEKADHEIKRSLYGFAFAFEGAMAGKFGGVDRQAIDRIRPQLVAALEPLRRAREQASPAGKERVDFWVKRTQFGIDWMDLGVAAADLGKMLGDARKAGQPLTAQQKQEALAAMDQLLARARALIEIIVSDAKHIGDLGQIASLNRYVYRYLLDLRADLASRPLKD